MTFFCCVAKLFFDHKRAKADTNSTTKQKLERWSSALNDTIASFSDQQIVTGISIVIGGLSQLQWGNSSFHWQAVVNLAWLFTVTHLITLTVLRDQRPSDVHLKILRSSGMGALMVLLLCAMWPVGYLTTAQATIYSLQSSFPGCLYKPSITWKDQYGSLLTKSYNWFYILLAYGLIIFSFATRVLLLFSEHTSIAHRIFRGLIDRLWTYLEGSMDSRRPFELLNKSKFLEYKILQSANTFHVAGSELYSSKVGR
jgi:membrane-associated HD superfamily phosphohydrolase